MTEKRKISEVCDWYDGYQFGQTEIFNPWSVINYIDENCQPKAFWLSTGSNEIIGEIISVASPEITENLRRLMQGESVVSSVDSDVIYPEVKKNPSSIYSFLLVTGYLRCTEIMPQNDGSFICRVSIPNKEISFVYAKEIIPRMIPAVGESTAACIQQAIFEKDAKGLQKSIEQYLMETISVFDTSSEAFYQGLMLGLCAILNHRYSVRSNRESGLGRFDLQLQPMDMLLPGFIFELKSSRDQKENLELLAQAALDQIQNKQYETEMHAAGVKNVISMGLAFRGKEVALTTQTEST